jgi:hypothetical protein
MVAYMAGSFRLCLKESFGHRDPKKILAKAYLLRQDFFKSYPYWDILNVLKLNVFY